MKKLKSDSRVRKPCKTRRTGGKDDRISNLPDAIIHHIFSFGSTIDVVRTSILAKRWRCLWTQTPSLDFNDNLFPIVNRENAFAHFVSGVQRSYKAQTLQRYHLSIRSSSNANFVNTWVHFAVQMSVKELNLDMVGQEAFKMPCSESIRVLRLELGNGKLRLANTGCFSSLRMLCLSGVKFNNNIRLDVTSYHYPCLRSLRIKNCSGLYHLNINCPLLELLKIKRCLGLDQLYICAEALRYLCVNDAFSRKSGTVKISARNLQTIKWLDYVLDKFSMENFISLKVAHISLVIHYNPEKFESYIKSSKNFLNRFACAETLQLEIPCFWGFSTQRDLLEGVTAPTNIKHLMLLVGHESYVFRGISHLFRSCPNLETLDIHTINRETHVMLNVKYPFTCLLDMDERWEYQCQPLHHLREADFCGFGGKDYEIEFIKFLLKYGVVLKRMSVRFCGSAGVSKRMRVEITNKLLKVEMASPDALLFVI